MAVLACMNVLFSYVLVFTSSQVYGVSSSSSEEQNGEMSSE